MRAKDEARQITPNIAKLLDLHCGRSRKLMWARPA